MHTVLFEIYCSMLAFERMQRGFEGSGDSQAVFPDHGGQGNIRRGHQLHNERSGRVRQRCPPDVRSKFNKTHKMFDVNLCPTKSVVKLRIMSILHICDRVNSGQQSSVISVSVTRSIAEDVRRKLCTTRS